MHSVALGVLEGRDGQTGLIAFNQQRALLRSSGRSQGEKHSDGLIVIDGDRSPLDESLAIADAVGRRGSDGTLDGLAIVIDIIERANLGIRLVVGIKTENGSDFEIIVRMIGNPTVFKLAQSTVQMNDFTSNIIRGAFFIEQSIGPFIPSQLIGNITRSHLSSGNSPKTQ